MNNICSHNMDNICSGDMDHIWAITHGAHNGGNYFNFGEATRGKQTKQMAACSESSMDNSQNSDSSFVWDETSHLYFHASGHNNMHSVENSPPPSKWLEDTLIELYLLGNTDAYDLEEGEWFPEHYHGIMETSENVSEEGASWDEENWKAQYGQVIRSSEEPIPQVPGSKKDVKGEVMRLVGRLMRKSAKLHPSMPSGGCLLRTAPICEVYHDLSPSARFLASLSVYDSSNPTNDWRFPELSFGRQLLPPSKYNRKEYTYKDRVAERRALHGGFGVGPEEATSKALNMSFGASSYARRILENMGWKQTRTRGKKMCTQFYFTIIPLYEGNFFLIIRRKR
ncbi:hypothetical protein UlMin_037194 [Ulmus minor]